jgi:hypothetical protein
MEVGALFVVMLPVVVVGVMAYPAPGRMADRLIVMFAEGYATVVRTSTTTTTGLVVMRNESRVKRELDA